MRYLPYIAIIICIIWAIIMTAIVVRRSPAIELKEVTNSYHTTTPVITKIIQNNVPAEIETLFVDGQNYEIARYHAEIDTNKVNVSLDIKYNERSNVFDIRHNVTAMRDSVYFEKIIEKTIKSKPKFIRLSGDIGVGIEEFKSASNINIASGDIALGIKLIDKYSFKPYIHFRENNVPLYGVRLGVDF